MSFQLLVAIVAVFAGVVASVAGFGIGSLLTPLLGISIGVKLAVAAVSIPHFVATALRFWTLRHQVDKHVLYTFGLASAAGGLVGALLHARAASSELRIVFASILLFVGISGFFGLTERIRFHRGAAWVAGGVSGGLGGLVGNQGGIRAAAMLGFDVPREAFVATATAIGLIVDGVRMPVYFVNEGAAMLRVWPLILIATGGVVVGTLIGRPILHHVPERLFRRMVSLLIACLGVAMFFQQG
jgi:uncharacterized protein